MAQIEYVQNKESGLSVRTKINQAIGGVNSLNSANYTTLQYITNLIVDYYKKSETYNKIEINDIVSSIKNLEPKIIQNINEVTELGYVYFLPVGEEGINKYDEYLYINGIAELIGSFNSDVDLSNYITTEQLNTAFFAYVSKETGKELIPTTALTKLNSLPTKIESDNFYVAKEEGKSLIEDVKIEKLNSLPSSVYSQAETQQLIIEEASARTTSLQEQKNTLAAVDSNLQGQINTHESQIQDIVTAYIDNKGYFATYPSLETSHPTPEIGDTAYVANASSSTGYYIYNVVDGVWTSSTVEAPPVAVPIGDYILKTAVSLYNITNEIPLPAGSYYTLATAIAAIPTNIRKLGLKITFQVSATNTETWEFFNGTIGNITNVAYWRKTANSTDLSLKIDKTAIKDVLGTSTTDVMSQKAITDKLGTKADQTDLDQLAGNKTDKNDIQHILIDSIGGWGTEFNGISSSLVCDDIVISQIGDYIEFDLETESTGFSLGGYSFAGRNNTSNSSIGISLLGVTVRDKNNAWTIAPGDVVSLSAYPKRLKIKIERNLDGISLYYNGIQVKTAPFTGNILIQRFGDSYSSSSGYWKGVVYSIKTSINGFENHRLLNYLPGTVTTDVQLVPYVDNFLTPEQASAINKGVLAEEMVNKISPLLLSLRNDVGETDLARTIFSLKMYLSDIGDYVEIKCSCPEYVSANTSNICMFVGTLTNGGLYNNSFYFRSNSTVSADYRIWTFPVGFDPKILHTYKLQIIDDGVGGKLWELFVDGVSWGTKSFSINANISVLNGSPAPASVVRYDYEYVNVNSIGEEKHFTASELFLLSENAKILPVLTFERISQEQEEQNTRLDGVETLAEDTKSKVINIGNIYATDLYYSSYNRKFESDGVKSSTYLDKPYLIESEGDYFEIKARYYGDMRTFQDKLALVTGTHLNSRFGWYNSSQFRFRPYGTDYITWDLSASGIDLFEWNTYRLEVVSGGVELFINGISMGAKPLVLTGYKINAIASYVVETGYVQKYDVKYFKAVSQIDGEIYIDTLALYAGSENVELLMSEGEDDVFAPNPLCFVSYDNSAKQFNVYIRDEENQNTYYGFLIGLQTSRGTPNDPIYYSHAWRLYSGAIYTYNKHMNVMTPTGITTVTEGESECVFMYTDVNGAKVDFTGGVHGDETIDITIGDFAKFYFDGIPLTESELLESFTMRACSEFKYIQKSSIHETAYSENNVDTELAATGAGDLTLKSDTKTFAIDGVDTGIPAYATNTVFSSTQAIINDGITLSVSGANTWVLSGIRRVYNDHPIVASHLKKSVMKRGKFHTENTLIFNNTRDLASWYVGIYCLGKGVATIGHNENYEDVELTGSGGTFLNNNNDGDYRLFEAYNPTTGGSAIVKSWITDEGGVLDDNNCVMHIWDRVPDSKYYRKVNSFAPIIGERMTTVTEVEYNKRSD